MDGRDIFISECDQDNMDLTLDYSNEGLMSSDLFDSMFSMDFGFDNGILSTLENDEDLNTTDACRKTELLSPQSLDSESNYSTDNTDPAVALNDELDNRNLLSFLDSFTDQDPIEEVEQKIVLPVVVKKQTPTKVSKLVIQNPTNKKSISKELSIGTQVTKKIHPQMLKFQQLGNGRSVFLPINFEIVNTLNDDTKTKKSTKMNVVSSVQDETDSDEPTTSSHQYAPLILSNEEKRLLAKEGIQLPTHLPLTKIEERELKRIRRKIRNKISAQDSRKRKKEYVDGLEERIKRGAEENKSLVYRIRQLQRQNRSLIAHINRMQTLICKSSISKANPSTCLMVVLLSALLVSIPNFRLPSKPDKSNGDAVETMGTGRALLSNQAADDDITLDDLLSFRNGDDDTVNELDMKLADLENATGMELGKIFDDARKKFGTVWMETNVEVERAGMLTKLLDTMRGLVMKHAHLLDNPKPISGGTYNKNGFIEPDIDDFLPGDDEPPMKRSRIVTEELVAATLDMVAKSNGRKPPIAMDK